MKTAKEVYANIIDSMGHDAGAVCNWNGVESVSIEDWHKAWWEAFNEQCEYERLQGAMHERKRIIAPLQND